jgi:hypothetical protein
MEMERMDHAEITEQIFGADYHVKLAAADKREPVYTLAETLSYKTITALRLFGRLYKISERSKMDKRSLIPILIQEITDAEILAEHLLALDTYEWKLFKKAVKVRQVTDDGLLVKDYRLMLELGIMTLYHYEGHFHHIVPQEIRNAYFVLEKDGLFAERECEDLLSGCVSNEVRR